MQSALIFSRRPFRIVLPFFCVAATALAHAAPLPPPEDDGRASVPDAAAQEEAMKIVNEVFAAEFEAAKTADERSVLADKLLRQADESTDPINRFVLLQVARDISALGADVEKAFRAIDEMATWYAIDALEMKTQLTAQLAKAARFPAQHKALAASALDLADEALWADRYDAAVRLAQTAYAEARKSRDGALVKQANARANQVGQIADAYAQLAPARATLDEDPTDPHANLQIGRFLCLSKDDWQAGLAYLALGADAALKSLAVKELDRPATPDEQMALADAYSGLAEKEEGLAKSSLKARAAHWYRQAQPGLSGLRKAKVDKWLSEWEVEQADDSRPGARRRPQRPDDDVEFGGHYYKVFWQSVSWVQAKSYCERLGGYLACVETPEERVFLANLKGQGRRHGKVVWVGGYRNHKGTWRWVNGTEVPQEWVHFAEPGRDFLSYSNKDFLNCRPMDGFVKAYSKKRIQGFICEWDR